MDKVNCERLIDYFNQSLTEEETTQFELHLKQCTECQTELNELIEITGNLPYLSEPINPPSGMKKRILDHVFEEDQVHKQSADLVNSPMVIQKRNWWTPLLAAFLLLSLLGNGYAFIMLNKEKDGPTNPPSLVNSVTLLPSETFAASGNASLVTEENKLNVIVQANQLKPLEGNQVYQVWLIEDGKPIPAGAFEPNEEGKGIIYYSIESNHTKKWDTIAITLEPESGNKLPKGEIVLSSSL